MMLRHGFALATHRGHIGKDYNPPNITNYYEIINTARRYS